MINFLLDEHSPFPHRVNFAEGIHAGALADRIRVALDLFPCNLLLVHRDAERASVAERQHEIDEATASLPAQRKPRTIHIIPVRMTESWLLIDPLAIRRAAGNPSGTDELEIPAVDRLESTPNPKEVLFRALTSAKSVGARRLRAFRPETVRHRVSELMDDYGSLRALPSFRHFEEQVVGFFASAASVNQPS
jgi:hypothetical protein